MKANDDSFFCPVISKLSRRVQLTFVGPVKRAVLCNASKASSFWCVIVRSYSLLLQKGFGKTDYCLWFVQVKTSLQAYLGRMHWSFAGADAEHVSYFLDPVQIGLVCKSTAGSKKTNYR
jgi:hypothetical protein